MRIRVVVLIALGLLFAGLPLFGLGPVRAHHKPDHPHGKPKDDALRVGFGARRITPVTRPGETAWPPAEWAPYLRPGPNGVWGEAWSDDDGDGCYPQPHTLAPAGDEQPEGHVDDPWNSATIVTVRGVDIVGDPQSTGKWDGLWANAGFGAKCATGVHDDTWARAVLYQAEGKRVALVSLDVVGFLNPEVERAKQELNRRYPDLELDELIVASTHTHEGVDTMGYWGQTIGIDGKYPAYQAFIRSQIADAVNDAFTAREKAVAKFAVTDHTVGIRDSRDPRVIDPKLYTAQFLREDGTTIGTIVNWSNHPEAQGSNNSLVSSDFVHGTRVEMEKALGGTSVYFSGSVGGLMTPLGVDIPGFGSGSGSWDRTYEVGRLVAVAALESLATAPVTEVDTLDVQSREIWLDVDNTALRGLNAAGVFDVPTYIGGESWGKDPAGHRAGVPAGGAGTQMRTEMVRVTIGPAMFLTVPGELFPELEIGGYGRQDPGCDAADTGRPHELVIDEQYDEQYQFVLGLGQDELGYIVPGYDFHLAHLPATDPQGDGLVPLGAIEQEDACGDSHYEESVSASSVMAPNVTCAASELAGRDPWVDVHEHPCSRHNTHTNPYGLADDHGHTHPH